MPAQILFNSPTPELTSLCREVAASLQIEIEVIEGVFEEAADKARQAIARNPNIHVVISRDASARAIEAAVDLPIVHLAPTASDYFYALRQAREHGQRIGLVAYQQEARDLELSWFTELLGVDVRIFAYANPTQFQTQIAWAASSGMQVVVMRSARGARLAREVGLTGIVVQTNRQAVVQAMERATTVIKAMHQEWERSELLQTILDHVYDGVLAIGPDRKVTLCNHVAERTFGLRPGKVVDEGPSPLNNVLQDCSPRRNYLVELGSQKILASRATIAVGQKVVGTVVTFQDITKIQRMEERIRKEVYSQGLVARYSLDNIIGKSQPMRLAVTKAREIAGMDATVLIIGESGTGKELFAQGIHQASERRRNGPFVAINCAALPSNLLESELFGYEHGAFTGARKGGKPGLFELAHGGTIFLDEIGKISLDLQARLLRVLQERQVMRVGGDRVLPVDIRIIAASNDNLLSAVEEGNFRVDLYYRLNIIRLTVPPLRARREDIPLLATAFLERAGQVHGIPARTPSETLLAWLQTHHWPGNVRELENIMERYVVLSRVMDDRAFLDELRTEVTSTAVERTADSKLTVDLGPLAVMEQQILEQAIRRVGDNRAALARILGISRTTLWTKLKQANVATPQDVS
ncbi:MAG: sigma 54-interacting transcriptional regulator [Rhodospirillales bacterium]|nr:sigma 54-interacting transcriptional regulator [Rhodospirillales bacterium]